MKTIVRVVLAICLLSIAAYSSRSNQRSHRRHRAGCDRRRSARCDRRGQQSCADRARADRHDRRDRAIQDPRTAPGHLHGQLLPAGVLDGQARGHRDHHRLHGDHQRRAEGRRDRGDGHGIGLVSRRRPAERQDAGRDDERDRRHDSNRPLLPEPRGADPRRHRIGRLLGDRQPGRRRAKRSGAFGAGDPRQPRLRHAVAARRHEYLVVEPQRYVDRALHRRQHRRVCDRGGRQVGRGGNRRGAHQHDPARGR